MNSYPASLDLDQYRIHSRREIIALLRSLRDRNQLVSMMVKDEAVVTSLLEVDDENGIVIIDAAPGEHLNQRATSGAKVSFETVLDQIRILFSSEQVELCSHDRLPALRFPLPASVVRLQRREFYRVATPVANPVHCTIEVVNEDASVTTVMTTLHNISAGGVALIDDKKMLDTTIGRIYTNCRIGLPGGVPLVVKLQVRNSDEFTLMNGKAIRRLGCMFMDLAPAPLAAVQRYITKLERERNAALR